MTPQPLDTYGELMFVIRNRFDTIESVKSSPADAFSAAETCAFHGRKIVEAIAFGCLIALENSFDHIPRDVKGQWNAGAIFESLEKKKLGTAFPSPSIIRLSTPEEAREHGTKNTIEGQPDRRLSKEELIAIYERLHRWNHEINPYVTQSRDAFLAQNRERLFEDVGKLWAFLEKHFISIGGKGFFCVLKDSNDGQVKVVPLSK